MQISPGNVGITTDPQHWPTVFSNIVWVSFYEVKAIFFYLNGPSCKPFITLPSSSLDGSNVIKPFFVVEVCKNAIHKKTTYESKFECVTLEWG